jgi:hypothetical protein
VREAGITVEQVLAAMRIAAVVNATAAVLDAEAAGQPGSRWRPWLLESVTSHRSLVTKSRFPG